MAFEDLITRINVLFGSLHEEPEDLFSRLEELHHELNQFKATGQPLPDDLLVLERRLAEELSERTRDLRHVAGPLVDTVRIERENWDEGGRYVATVAGIDGEAELTFTRTSARLVSADHTEAPEAMRGTGAAQALVAQLVSDAREEGFEIEPRCSYIAAQRERHPEWADVIRPR